MKEHSENKLIIYFENKVGPGVFLSNVQQRYNIQSAKYHATRIQRTHNQLHMVCGFSTLAVFTFVERWTGALRVGSRFKHPELSENSIFRALWPSFNLIVKN